MVNPITVPAALQNWPASAIALVLTAVVLLLARNIYRPPLPGGAAWTDKGWPILGSPGFFTATADFLRHGVRQSSNGHFNFYCGPYPIVALSGEAARKAFYTTRGLDLDAGFRKLTGVGPDLSKTVGSMRPNLIGMFKRFLSTQHLNHALPFMGADVDSAYRSLDLSAPLDPFFFLYRVVYKMTHRSVGCSDLADDPKLLEKTLHAFSRFEGTSPLHVLFPSLPLPGKLGKIWAGATLYFTLRNILRERVKTGERKDDAMQMLMDAGESEFIICLFIIGALFAGLINTGTQAAWMLAFLAHDPEWYAKMQAEVDAAIAKHRSSVDETPVDVLRRLTVEEWESEFPLIGFGLRDSIRITLTGASLRQNITGKDLTIGDTGVVVPKDAFAVYGLDHVHMNRNVYRDPHKWDPARYLPDRAEDKKTEHGYIGWGSGLHPCVGPRFAKLEVTITTAMFLAYFDFKLVDKQGNPTKSFPKYDGNALSPRRPLGTVFLNCTRRF